MEERERVKRALKRCAVGLRASEVVEEFAVEDGELKLVKRKVTRRDVPPDIKALKMYLDGESGAPTDEELAREREKLVKLLKEDDGE